MEQKTGIELCIEAAVQHGKYDDPDHEVGDRQDSLRKMWKLLTPGQRLAFMADDDVKELIENNIPGVDLEEAFDRLAAAQQDEVSNARLQGSRVDLFSDLITQFPGLLDDSEVNGGDAVDWLNSNLQLIRQLSQSRVEQEEEDSSESPAPSM